MDTLVSEIDTRVSELKLPDSEQTQRESVFFGSRTTKKNTLFSIRKKPHEPLSSRGGGYPDLSGPT